MAGHGHIDPSNKQVALLIAVLALFLAFAETLAKGAQTSALAYNVEASNLWAFFQAKTVRQTVLRSLSEAQEIEKAKAPDPKVMELITRRAEDWQKTITRWETEPDTQEGRRELAARAKDAEKKRDDSMAKYHHFELASGAFQIGIVLASSMVITGIAALMWLGAALGGVGLVFTGIGLFAPHAVHLL
jgi:Domain of unknown function (DUF4337)